MDTYLAYHVFIKLVVGGLNYLIAKLAIDSYKKETSVGQIPGLMTVSTFVSLFLVGFPLFVQEWRAVRAQKADASVQSWRVHGIISIAGILEMCAVFLSMYGSVYLPASMLVFMKATRVLWSAILSKYVLKRTLYGHHWVGVALTFIGLVPIFAVSMIKKSSSTASTAWMIGALAMVFACEFFRAVRIIMEERQMKEYGVSPAFVQYVEGYAGLAMSIVLLAILGAAGKEKVVESFEVMGDSSKWAVTALLVTHTIAHGLVNYSSTVVTKMMSSVHNAIISELRIVVVWAPEFIIGALFQHHGKAKYGKDWSCWYLLDIPGFAIIVASAVIYSGTLRLPFAALYPADKAEEKVVSPSTNDHCTATI